MVSALFRKPALLGALLLLAAMFPLVSSVSRAPEVAAQDVFSKPSRLVTLPPPIVLPSTMPFAGSPPEVPCAQEPSWPGSTREPTLGSTSSQPPGTALEPRPGTGSGLLTGLLPGSKIDLTHKVAPEVTALVAQLVKGLEGLGSVNPKVSISPTLPPETSQSLSQASDRVSLLASVASVVLTIFGLGKLGPWVALAAGGLRSVIAARMQAPAASPGLDLLLSQVSQLLAANQAALSSTPPPASSPASPTGAVPTPSP